MSTIFLILGCNNRETIVEKDRLLGNDYRLFQNTAAWELAKAVQDEDMPKIKEEIIQNKININFQEPRFGSTLLMLAIRNSQYQITKTLLEIGANPNISDLYRGESAVISAAINDDPKYLELILKYKGNPNALEKVVTKEGDRARSNALNAAISYLDPGSFEKVKLLVKAGANLNYYSIGPEVYTRLPLADAITARKMDIVLYLLEKEADYKRVMYTRIDNEQIFILEALRQCLIELNSDQYKHKLEVIDFLKEKGLDYNKEPIPDYVLEDIKKKYLKNWEDYIKRY